MIVYIETNVFVGILGTYEISQWLVTQFEYQRSAYVYDIINVWCSYFNWLKVF